MQFQRGHVGQFFKGDPTLKLWLPFEGNSIDFSGNGNNGTDTNIIYGTPYGKFGQGVKCNASNIILDYNFFGSTNSPRTLSFWLNPITLVQSGKDEARIYTADEVSPDGRIACRIYNTGAFSVYAFSTNPDLVSGDSLIKVEMWQNVIFTFDGSVAKLYYNGSFITSQNWTLISGTGTKQKRLFDYIDSVNGISYNGRADEIAFFSRALSPKEISDYYLWSIGTPQRRIFYVPINTSNFFHFFK